jgi:TolB protein
MLHLIKCSVDDRWLRSVLFVLLTSCVAISRADDPVADAFAKLDADGDGKLNLDEYLQQTGNRKELKRDFQVFDFDGDGFLTQEEFAAVPGQVPAARRGPLPDPFDHLLHQSVAAMDESYGHWNRRPQETIAVEEFVTNFLASISLEGSGALARSLAPLADPNGDGQVSRAEARRFLEIQLGLRSKTGHPLRLPNGRILMIRHFQSTDANNDNVLTREEFLQSWPGEGLEERFARGDLNGDGIIDMEEFSNPEWIAWYDPVATFLKWDTNLDGFLDAEEMAAEAPHFLQVLTPPMIPAFDLDGDGKLSLEEYRLSMLGNRITFWEQMPTDRNWDQQLSFQEFTYRNCDYHLLRWFYFHRLDLDGDGKLSTDEFPFKVRVRHSFHYLSADGSEFFRLYKHPEFTNMGSPDVSPDGKQIAFDGFGGGSTSGSRIMLMNSDGTGMRDLCAGMMPTWSADGKRIAFSRSSAIWIMNADGSDPRQIASGWGAQWSPDGKSIAYTSNGGLSAYDVETGESRQVLSREDHPYSYIYYNMNWSPDGSRLAFKGRSQEGTTLASISMTGDDPDLKTHHQSTRNFDADISWAPDGRRIYFSLHTQQHRKFVLHVIDTETDDPPRIAEGIDLDFTFYGGVTFTPDGKGMIVVTKEATEEGDTSR